MSKGQFITIEGIEGAGKTSCMAAAAAHIEALGHRVLQTREPGGTALGEALRELLLGHRHDGMADETELLLMFAARAEHLHARIRPALAEGRWVLCDRFTDATRAYQGAGRGMPAARIEALADWVHGDLWPDLTLLLDLPVSQGLARAGRRSRPDRFESQALDFFERVRAGYLEIARREPERVRVIDASRGPEEVVAAVVEAIDAHVGKRND